MFSFSDLCIDNTGAGEFIAIAKNFSHVIILDIPKLKTNEDSSRRFILLVIIF
jgi:predicted ATPase